MAARVAGVHRVFKMGGAHAIAALAYGTATVPRVDKIVGPGNVWVATAKRLAFGAVGIDAVAGPTEIVVVADETARADWVAADLLSQAEHDEAASAVLIATSRALIEQARERLLARTAEAPRRDIVRASLESRGALILARDLSEAADLVNRFAPEHLELAVARPDLLLKKIRHAGAIFLGHRTSVVLGDFVAGPNHVLPTAGTARFFSPLGAQDFVKRSSVIEMDAEGLRRLGPHAESLALLEGLPGHAEAVRVRLDSEKGMRKRGGGRAGRRTA